MSQEPFRDDFAARVPSAAATGGAEQHELHAPTIPLHQWETIIDAWQEATLRLEQTHAALRGEVARLTDELAVKNRELARKNRLADLGQIASHVAHEVRNNLVPVSLYAGALRRQLADRPESLEVLQRIEAGLTALDAMVHDMLNFTAERTPKPTRVPVRELLDELLAGLAPQCSAQGIRVAVDAPRTLVVEADREALRRTLLNLVLNAVDAMPAGGDLVLTAVDCRNCVEIEVADSGTGLSDEARRRAFEPFFTTKASGIGLGLAIVQRLMEAHGGGITVCNCPDGGAAFTVRLPRQAARLEAAA